ncbi:hypothetical protein BLS_003706 [Venturia inaequalis]|uniref:Uncharacterized protein n=1 Tax=Venturia inaequalis TaxID=5025 RepID=A0A8H3V9G3_VENIN|nr:hypothetical protein BLS_003706 [Venturia inaequalis]RDI85820.1 hypothetical protein Vi05172_g4197 [Venturia inaequalis]
MASTTIGNSDNSSSDDSVHMTIERSGINFASAQHGVAPNFDEITLGTTYRARKPRSLHGGIRTPQPTRTASLPSGLELLLGNLAQTNGNRTMAYHRHSIPKPTELPRTPQPQTANTEYPTTMSINSANNTDNKEYPKIEVKTRPNRSSSLTLLIQQDRSPRPALPSSDAAHLEPSVAETNAAAGMNLLVGTWKREDRIPPRPSQAAANESGFEMEAAKKIVEKFGGGMVDSETDRGSVTREGDDDNDGEKNGVTIPRR